jgi:hypothetical protein
VVGTFAGQAVNRYLHEGKTGDAPVAGSAAAGRPVQVGTLVVMTFFVIGIGFC